MSQSTITLLIYILLLAPAMIVGLVFARRKMFAPYHKYTMTAITIFNWVLIIALMQVSYRNFVLPYLPDYLSDVRGMLATIHLVTGAIAQLLATYLVILMWTERTSFAGILPSALRVRRIKPVMRTTLALWLITVVLGIGIYLTWYAATPATESQIAPVATEEATAESTDAASPASTEDASSEPASTEAADPSATEDAEEAREEASEEAEDVSEDLTKDAEDRYEDMTKEAEDRDDD